MDRKQIVETGMKARRELLQRKGFDEIRRMAEEFGIPLPDQNVLFDRPEQTPAERRRRETEYKLGVISEIVRREYRNT